MSARHALYSRGPGDVAADKAATRREGADLLVFTQADAAWGLPRDPASRGNFYCPQPDAVFDSVTVGPSVRLFENNWSKALLARRFRNVRPGGVLRVPYFEDPVAERNGYWSLGSLQSFFRSEPRIVAGSLAEFVRSDPSEQLVRGRSVLDWYFLNAGILETLRGLAATALSAEMWVSALAPMSISIHPSALRELRLRREGEPWVYEDPFAHESYLVSGVGYKSALLAYLTRRFVGSGRSASLLDVGGGPGLLAAEALLDADAGFASATCCDPSVVYAVYARQLYEALGPVRSAFSFALAAAEEAEYAYGFDVVSFIGSLLYVPRELAGSTLDRVWDALKPGGILVVHENIRAASYAVDYDVMFTVEELDALLGRFGRIERYLSTATVAVSEEQAAAKSVFRIVQKS